MKKMLSKVGFLSTIENASITRKFGVLFFSSAILPLLVIYTIFVSNYGKEEIVISSYDLGFTMFFATLGILASFIGMRSALKKIQKLHSPSESQDKPQTAKEHNEIDSLARSFAAIQKQIDENISKLEAIKQAH